jgi:biotin operon repressor
MANASIEKQVDTTVKVLLTLLAEPRVSAAQLAKATEQSQSNIARLIARFKEAGIKIDYDFSDERYKIDFDESLQKSILGRYAKKLARILNDAAKSQTPVKFVQSLDRYSLPEFAQAAGYTPQNVYNMIIGYKGAHLPAGWVAYQMQDRGKWLVQRMTKDRRGNWTTPENVKDAFRFVVGTGEEIGSKAKQASRLKCKIDKCQDGVLSKGLCTKHYYMQRRAPSKFRTLKQRAVGE